jgi:hypothetical protein
LYAGRYAVAIKPSPDDINMLTIRVDVPDIAQETASEHPAPATASNPGHPFSNLASIFTHIKPTPGNDEIPPTKPTKNATASSTTASSGAPTAADFKTLVENWQKIKRNAVKNRDISELPNVLSGHALAVQTGGIKWLSDNHKFIEMVPKTVELGKVTEIVKDKQYNVVVTVKEASKLYDELTNQLLRNSEDTYLVNYVVEKEDGKYFINDSSIVKIQTPQAGTKK